MKRFVAIFLIVIVISTTIIPSVSAYDSANINSDNLVTDTFSIRYSDEDASYASGWGDIIIDIPQINISSGYFDRINEEILEKHQDVINACNSNSYDHHVIYKVEYEWIVVDDILSLTIWNYTIWDTIVGYIYNCSLSNHADASIMAIAEMYGFSTEEEYYSTIRMAVGAHLWNRWLWDNDYSSFDDYFAKTTSDENISKVIPYIDTDGELCLYFTMFHPAASGTHNVRICGSDLHIKPEYMDYYDQHYPNEQEDPDAAPKMPFTDVKNTDYFYNPVKWAVKEGITTGVSDTSFAPGDTCTRAHIVTFLWRAFGKPKAVGDNPFVDVPSGQWYSEAVLWAAERGLTNGVSETSFAPDQPCTRAQIVTFLYRIAGEPVLPGSSGFKDVSNPDAYYYRPVIWAVANDITYGTDDTHFSPDDYCTRAQAVTFIYRSY